MSPEQMSGAPVDHRSDLFSFGIVFCELLTGKHPFRRGSALETMTAILRDPPDLATRGSSELPPGLVVLIRRLLAKSPEERYQSTSQVRADLLRLTTIPAAEPDSSAEPADPPHRPRLERAELLRLLDSALAGHGSLVLIGGEPGIGKTHLTRAILAEATRRGSYTVVGHCYEMEGAPPYVPFIEMLEYSARVVPRESFRHTLGDAAPEMAKLMPELRRMFPDIPPPFELPPEQQRRFLFNAYRDAFERAARLTPMVVVLEDLHWADEPTLLLLQHLTRTVGTVPVLMIGTYRDVELEVGRPFARILESLTAGETGLAHAAAPIASGWSAGDARCPQRPDRRRLRWLESFLTRPRATRSSSRRCSGIWPRKASCSTRQAPGARDCEWINCRFRRACGW